MALPVTIDRTSREPLYRQVERQFRDAIDDGRIAPGDRVPSVRDLARELGVGRLTVATAYEQLAADGYLVGRIGFGTVVAPTPPSRVASPPMTATPRSEPPRPLPRTNVIAAPPTTATGRAPRFDLRPGPPAGAGMAVGPALERLLREAWRDLAGGSPATDPAGDPLLRSAIASHVRAARGGRCGADQVVVLSGGLIGITAVARLWLAAGASIAVEDPPDPPFRRALDLAGATVRAVATDRHGLRLDDLPEQAAVLLASPRIQAVTGAGMPLARRVGLLAWAATTGAVVVEDARGDELALTGDAGPSLHGLDDDGRVIHLGAFAALLHPGVQLAYAVLPAGLAAPFTAAVAALDPGATPVQQRALGRFLADGHLDRHLARVRRALAERFDAAIGALRRDLGWLVSVELPAGGTRMVVTIEDDRLTATHAAEAAERAGIAIEPLSRSRIVSGTDRELLVDVGRHEPFELARAIHVLAGALAEERRRTGERRRDEQPSTPRAPSAVAPIPRRWPTFTRSTDRHHDAVRAGGPRAARDG